MAETVYDLLVPDGALILISHDAGDGRLRPPGPGHPEVPRAAVQKLICDYLGDSTRHDLATWNQGQPARFDTVVASYFSLSYAAPRWFGNRRADFESSLRHLLREYSPGGLFWHWPGDTGLVIATKR